MQNDETNIFKILQEKNKTKINYTQAYGKVVSNVVIKLRGFNHRSPKFLGTCSSTYWIVESINDFAFL